MSYVSVHKWEVISKLSSSWCPKNPSTALFAVTRLFICLPERTLAGRKKGGEDLCSLYRCDFCAESVERRNRSLTYFRDDSFGSLPTTPHLFLRNVQNFRLVFKEELLISRLGIFRSKFFPRACLSLVYLSITQVPVDFVQ